ncbi:MAG: acyltransferase family protein [Bacteroidia bacterium]|nr:acyltransferase family protein [Bacteroidia bacterium]NNF31490.1 acyltransferase family protein [Flavobacteriaceae bacterium]MBT8275565.1 acyltransferase family protein [Bacteroidia bacterium]NNJ82035.1 acyltransferase family protein [Flavobacteriaceae bacterium]NNK54069.1 acyltransferase family protein [Flavobacteriaceae bacterium]
MQKRITWIDQARGFSIFLVVYGHNFPTNEPYIYSFHVPLFFFIAGMFHPKKIDFAVLKRRAKMLLIPYFIWAVALFLFWWALGRNYGNSIELNLSPLKNFIGVFYAQGGSDYMDWGIPLWFIPCIFLVFVLRAITQKISNKFIEHLLLLVIFTIGFAWPRFFEIHLPWSLDVAAVALGFYVAGEVLKNYMIELSKMRSAYFFLFALIINIMAFYYNPEKVDMYRSIYGNEVLFFVSGFAGSIAFVLFFKIVPVFAFLSYLGRHTIVLLATHIRMLTVIKMIAFFIFGVTVFNFTEAEKLLLSAAQVIMVIPIIWFVNKYAPILDGKVKKN